MSEAHTKHRGERNSWVAEFGSLLWQTAKSHKPMHKLTILQPTDAGMQGGRGGACLAASLVLRTMF